MRKDYFVYLININQSKATIIVIDLDVIRNSDYIIDEGRQLGGEISPHGTVEEINRIRRLIKMEGCEKVAGSKNEPGV